MTKTTKIVRGIQSWIKFQKHQGVQSLTIKGKDALADLSQDKQGDTDLILNADKDKVNTVASNVPYLAIAHTTTGTDPNQEKIATLNQDLTKFDLGSDGLIDVSKSPTSITLYTSKIVDKIKELIAEAQKNEQPVPSTQNQKFGVSSGVISFKVTENESLTKTFEILLDGSKAKDVLNNEENDSSSGFVEIIVGGRISGQFIDVSNKTRKIVVPGFSGLVFSDPTVTDKIYLKFNVNHNRTHTEQIFIKLYGLFNTAKLTIRETTDEFALNTQIDPAELQFSPL